VRFDSNGLVLAGQKTPTCWRKLPEEGTGKAKTTFIGVDEIDGDGPSRCLPTTHNSASWFGFSSSRTNCVP